MNLVSFEDEHWHFTVPHFTCAHKCRHFWWYQGPFYDSTEAAKECQIGLPASSNQSFRWSLWWKFQDESFSISISLNTVPFSSSHKRFLYVQSIQRSGWKWFQAPHNRKLILEVGFWFLESASLSFGLFACKGRAFLAFFQFLSMYFRSKLGGCLFMSGIVHVLARDEQS